MKKNIFAILLILFAGAACNILGGSLSGVLKTVDNGTTWQPSNAIANSNNNISGLQVTKMYIDPQNNAHLYLSATNNGLWESNDNAQSWKQVLSRITAYGFYIDPGNTSNIFVSGIYGGHGKVVRSTDGGNTWNVSYNEASANNAIVAVAGNPNKQGEIYAALNSGQLVKSLDNGANWFIVYDFKTQISNMEYSRINNGLYVLLRNNGITESTDGGNNWTMITAPLTKIYSGYSNSYIPAGFKTFLKMAIDNFSAGVIYVTTSNGLFKTLDNGRSWDFINLPVKSSTDMPGAIATSHGGMIAYTSIGNTVFKTMDGGQSWATQQVPTNSLINVIIIDPVLSQVAYAGL